jgi:hypothetical protein
LLAACGDGPSAPPSVVPRAFAFSHIAGLAPDSGYVCPPRVEGAVARVQAGGEGIELFPNGDLWINAYVGTWERLPSTQQEAFGTTYNSVGRWAQRGDSLAFTELDWPHLPSKARLAGDSITFTMAAACPTDASLPGVLTLVYKETAP